MIVLFYDRKNKCQVKSTELMPINLIKTFAGVDSEGYPRGTPVKTITKKYGEDCLFVSEEVMSTYGYKSVGCPDHCNWDNHCNVQDLVFLGLETEDVKAK